MRRVGEPQPCRVRYWPNADTDCRLTVILAVLMHSGPLIHLMAVRDIGARRIDQKLARRASTPAEQLLKTCAVFARLIQALVRSGIGSSCCRAE